MRSRVGRVVAAVAAVGALVSGCGGGPSQVGSAAIVGSETIRLDQVQPRIEAVLARPDVVTELASRGGAGAPDIARDIVTQAVIHELSGRAAAAEGITITPAEVDAELMARGGVEAVLEGSLLELPVVRERIHDELVAQRLAARYVDGLAVTADIVRGIPSREAAEEAATIIAGGGPAADALFAQKPQASRRNVEFRASIAPDIASSVVFGTPAGGTGYFQPSPGQNEWYVFRVTDRRTDAPPVGPAAAQRIGSAELVGIGWRLLQPLAAELGVRVNPRYGVWSPIAFRVLSEDQFIGTVLPAPAG